MKYLKRFNNHTEYLKHFEKNDAVIPLVATCEEEEHVHYMDDLNYEFYKRKYLTFTALQDGTFSFSTNDILYSTNYGTTWTTLTAGTSTPTVNAGDKIMWKANGLTPTSSAGIGTFSSTGQFDVVGNIMSLVSGNSFAETTTMVNYQFYFLFKGCTNLISAKHLILPATTLADSCYGNMFYGCTGLTTAPSVLPATTLVSYCYREMFASCTSLTTAPELPATTLVKYCYLGMFSGCTNLLYIKALFKTTPSILTTPDWVRGVAASGTFVKNRAATWTTTGVNGVPEGWTVETASA